MSIADVYRFQQLISKPSRVTATSSTLVNLIYSNCVNKIACQEFLTPRLVIKARFLPTKKLDLNGISNGNNTVTYENFQKFDEQSFRNNISSQSLENLYTFSNPNEMRQVWKHTILAKANNHAPLRTKHVSAQFSVDHTRNKRSHA